MPTDAGRVKAWLRVDPADTTDDVLIQDCVDATNAWIARLPAQPASPDAADQGATMLAARLYRRRNSPSGVEGVTDAVVYVPRRDSDVDMLLRVGSFMMPGVG